MTWKFSATQFGYLEILEIHSCLLGDPLDSNSVAATQPFPIRAADPLRIGALRRQESILIPALSLQHSLATLVAFNGTQPVSSGSRKEPGLKQPRLAENGSRNRSSAFHPVRRKESGECSTQMNKVDSEQDLPSRH